MYIVAVRFIGGENRTALKTSWPAVCH